MKTNPICKTCFYLFICPNRKYDINECNDYKKDEFKKKARNQDQ